MLFAGVGVGVGKGLRTRFAHDIEGQRSHLKLSRPQSGPLSWEFTYT